MFAANVNVNVGGDSSDEKYQGMSIMVIFNKILILTNRF